MRPLVTRPTRCLAGSVGSRCTWYANGEVASKKTVLKSGGENGFIASSGFAFNLQLQEPLHPWSLHSLKSVSLLIFTDHWFLLLSVIVVWYSSGHTVGPARDLKEKKSLCCSWNDFVKLGLALACSSKRLAAGKLTHFAKPLNSQWSPDCVGKDGRTSLGSATLHGPVSLARFHVKAWIYYG